MLHQQLTLNCKGTLVDLSDPVLMGILNVTPDSFYDGGRYQDQFLTQTEKMLKEGATFIDVGGMSSRPGAKIIDVEEELQRVLPVIEAIHKAFPQALISVDTVRSKVAKEAVAAGACLVNDISAGLIDPDLLSTVATLKVPYVLMHMQGKPENMQNRPDYQDIILELTDFFINRLAVIRDLGIVDVILDVGFGFGKTVENNYQLLKNLKDFKLLDLPIMVGVSRKSMICKVLKINPEKALNGTTALHMIALQNGVQILRVHDVQEARECIELWQTLKAS
jgi:dihydropteroate synthase